MPKIVQSNNLVIRIIWTIFFLISITICGYMVIESVSNYLQFDVTTKIRQVLVNEIEFPTITICNLNVFATPTAYEYISQNRKKFNLSKYLLNATDDEIKLFQSSHIDPVYISSHPKFNKTLLKQFSYWPEYFLDCKFRSIKRNCSDIMSYYYNPLLKSCFIFNGPLNNGNQFKPLTVNRENEGFEISLFLGESDIFKQYGFQYEENGLLVFIKDPDVISSPLQGLKIKPGTLASIKVSNVKKSTLPKPYSNCIEEDNIDSDIAENFRKAGLKYSRQKCLQLYEDKLMIKKYNCSNSMALYKNVLNASICPMPMSMNFATRDYVSFCPHTCESNSYNLRISYSEYPSKNSYVKYWKNVLSPFVDQYNLSLAEEVQFARESLAKISIYFEEIKYTEITESPAMTFVDLVSNIGGTLGLFIGISLLSFVEIIELIFEIIAIIIKSRLIR